jgi:WD40 repeat protein
MVTSSDGNSIDVFDMQSQKLIQTIKLPPAQSGNISINALAINPDSSIIACGSLLRNGTNKSLPLYLFSMDTGKLYGRIPGLPAAVNKLVYSKDGSFLAVGFKDKKGLRIYKMHDLKIATSYSIPDMASEETEALKKFSDIEEILIIPTLLMSDTDYNGDITAMDFDANGRLVTCSRDGLIRLYNKDFKLLTKASAKNGQSPNSISFAPSGAVIAVSFSDTQKIDVLASSDLTYLYSPDTSKFAGGNINAVSWSSNGVFLYSSGQYKGSDYSTICRWYNEGKDGYSELGQADSVVNNVVAVKGGGVAYSNNARQIDMIDRRYGTVGNEFGHYWVAAGQKYGNVTYQIGGNFINYSPPPVSSGQAWFPISELKWPIQAIMGEIGSEVHFGKRWEFRGSLAHNISNNLGSKMEDSDWVLSPSSLDSYSESITDFRAYVIDASLRFWFLDRQKENKSYSLGIAAGGMYQDYYWEASNLDQRSNVFGTGQIGGVVGTYKFQSMMPYIELVFKSKINNFDFSGSIGGSPYMWVKDEDNHRLRAFVAEGKSHGYALKFALQGNYNFASRWFVGLRLNFMYYETNGSQEKFGYAYSYAGAHNEIDEKITSLQIDTMLTLGYRF